MSTISVKGFVGPAGTGKTYELVRESEVIIKSHEWEPYQSLLALTFMHGARRRLSSRLAHLRKYGIRIECKTIDSFCLQVVHRFRRYLGYDLRIEPNIDSLGSEDCVREDRKWLLSVEKLRKETIKLLDNSTVRQCIMASYPTVIIDEFQDCRGSLFSIIQDLAKSCEVYVGADAFQSLESNDHSCPAVNWLYEVGEVQELKEVKRTNRLDILASAKALRENRPEKGCIEIIPVDGPGLGAWEIAKNIAWNGWGRGSSLAIISPTHKDTSPFIKSIMKSLEHPLGKKKKIGPFPFKWEAAEEEQYQLICEKLPLRSEQSNIMSTGSLQSSSIGSDPIVKKACDIANKLACLRGEDWISRMEFDHLIQRCLHNAIAYKTIDEKYHRIALTVHGAKNREFDHVIVLWPYKIHSDKTFQRKLLYNAITRACQQVFVIVEGGKSRLASDEVLNLLIR